ncbi:hypothetical protein LEP1GSC187_0777 [Leptospira santarosai str. ZUN179]|uniref:Uncharacterized protein n=1 Tax=Leptospira santarosai str. ZUN179 TaxID=1049985 RepID=M6UJF1_9LEPT|nr:hypothetical protein LEP1GSC187_0777 [Leptospira santarosai str. ZUN179]
MRRITGGRVPIPFGKTIHVRICHWATSTVRDFLGSIRFPSSS